MGDLSPSPDLVLSADGRSVAYTAGRAGPGGGSFESLAVPLFVRRLNRLEALQVATVATSPLFSPDGDWMGFFDLSSFKKVPVGGGPAITVGTVPSGGRTAAWGPNDTIVYGRTGTGLFRLHPGGTPEGLTTPDSAKGELEHALPEFLPGGRAILFTIHSGGRQAANAQIAVLDLASHEHRVLLQGGAHPHFAASGHIVYAANGSLYAVGFDANQLEVRGTPVPVLAGVATKPSGAASFSLSSSGTLAYITGAAAAGPDATPRSLVWVDRQGHETPIPAPPRAYTSARLSPDATQVAVGIITGINEGDVWIWDLARQTLGRLTFDAALNVAPVWTPDGRRVVFGSTRAGPMNLYARAADGTGADVRLTTSAKAQTPHSVTPDGTFVIGHEIRLQAGRDLVRVALDGGSGGRGTGTSTAEGLVETPFEETNGEVSPDGRFLAYQSDQSGRFEIYMRPYPQVANGKWQVSTGGGRMPAWTRGGRELVYVDGVTHLTGVSVDTTGSAFRWGTPATLVTTAYARPSPARTM